MLFSNQVYPVDTHLASDGRRCGGQRAAARIVQLQAADQRGRVAGARVGAGSRRRGQPARRQGCP